MLAFRRDVRDFATVKGNLVITADVSTRRDLQPTFVARRQADLVIDVSACVDADEGTGGLALRYDENHFLSIEV